MQNAAIATKKSWSIDKREMVVCGWDDDSVHVVDHDVRCVTSIVRVCIMREGEWRTPVLPGYE